MFDARTLHGWLGNRDQFSKWIKLRLAQYAFEEGADYRVATLKAARGRPRREYLLTRDMAKELAMVENNDIGRRTRRYFIQMESAAKEMAGLLVAEGRPEAIPQAYAAR